MNLAILVGTIASPIRRYDLTQGGSVSKFRLKTTEIVKNDGEIRERSQIHLIDVFNSYLQEQVLADLSEGQAVEVQGSIESRNVAKPEEPDRWQTSIVIRGKGHVSLYAGEPQIQSGAGPSKAEGAKKQEPSGQNNRNGSRDLSQVPF